MCFNLSLRRNRKDEREERMFLVFLFVLFVTMLVVEVPRCSVPFRSLVLCFCLSLFSSPVYPSFSSPSHPFSRSHIIFILSRLFSFSLPFAFVSLSLSFSVIARL